MTVWQTGSYESTLPTATYRLEYMMPPSPLMLPLVSTTVLWHVEVYVDSESVKQKLYKRNGTTVDHMQLFLRRADGNTIFLYDDKLTLRWLLR